MRIQSLLSLFLPVLLCTGHLVHAQTQFQKTAGTTSNDRNYNIATMSDGSPVATGYTEDITGNQDDAYIIKYNRFGEVDWAKTYGSFDDESSWDVITSTNDEIIGVGTSNSLGTSHSGGTITKLDSDGNVLWSTGVTSANGQVDFYRVMETSTGHFVATGLVSTASQGDDIVVCKIDDAGNLMWSRHIGSNQADETMGMLETTQGNYLVAGLTKDNTGNGASDFAAVKLTPTGQVIWKKNYGGSNGERLNTVVEVNNSYYFAGWSSSAGQGANDIILMKTDTAGNVSWVKSYGTVEDERAFRMIYDSAANALMMGGYTDYPASRNTLLMKIDLNGDMFWAKSYGSTGTDGHWPTGLTKNDDEGYYVLGSTKSFGAGNLDLYLIKTDANGNTACNQKDPQFTQADVTGWSGSDFGTASSINLNQLALVAFSGVPWTISTNSQCCQLYAEAGPNDTLCPGDTVAIGTPGITGYSYAWTTGGGQVSANPLYNVTYEAAGEYQLEVSANNSGCPMANDTTFIQADGMPQLGFQEQYQFCDGDTMTISTNAEFDSIAWYSYKANAVIDTGGIFTTTESDTLVLEIYTSNQCLYLDTIYFQAFDIPVHDLGSDTAICQGDSLKLEAPTMYDHVWLHDTTISSQSITVDSAGSYILQLTNQICTYTDTIHVSINPRPVYSLGNDTMICEGESITLEAPANLDHTWLHNTTITSKSITVDSSGTYILQVTNQNNCAYTDSVEVIVNPLPQFSLGNDTGFCQGSSIVIQAPLNLDHTWLHDTSLVSKSIVVDSSGTYIAQVTDGAGCSNTDSIEVMFHPLPIFNLGSDTAICEDEQLQLEAPAQYDHTWLHDTSITDKIITIDTSGTYIAVVTDQNDCSYKDTVKVTVNPLPAFSLGNDTAICEGESVMLQAPSQFDFTWLHDTTITSTSITVDTGGTYIAEATDLGCSYRDTINITVNPLPTISLGPDQAICPDSTAIVSPVGNYSTFEWISPNSMQDSLFINTDSTVIAMGESAAGCQAFDTASVSVYYVPDSIFTDDTISYTGATILDAGSIYQSYQWNNDSTTQTITVSSTGWYTVTVTTVDGCTLTDSIFADKLTGIAKTQPSFKLYPNPVRNNLIIEMKNLNKPEVYARILSITGKEVQTVRLSGSNTHHSISVNELAQGIYLLELRAGAQTKKVLRFVKE